MREEKRICEKRRDETARADSRTYDYIMEENKRRHCYRSRAEVRERGDARRAVGRKGHAIGEEMGGVIREEKES